MRQAHLIRLGWTQLAVLIGSIACLMAAVWIIEVNSWQELYVRKFALPLLQERYGFRAGQVAFRRGSTPYELPGILSVTPGGRLDRMGVRAGDVPFEHHGHGFTAMYYALASAEEGHFARFDVVNGHQWNARDREDGFRTVVLHPAGAVMPVSLHWFLRDELPAPAGPSVLVTVPPAEPDSAWATLCVRNRATAESTPLYSMPRHTRSRARQRSSDPWRASS